MSAATDIGEPVNVVAVFDTGVRPVKFKWKGTVYPVKEVTYRWSSRRGMTDYIHFSVTDGATLFELVYNTATTRWTLDRIDDPAEGEGGGGI